MKKILALMIVGALSMVTFAQDKPADDATSQKKKGKKGGKKKQQPKEDAAPKQ